MNIDSDEYDSYLEHYGTPRKSGRYPWGSGGEEGSQRNRTLVGHVAEMRRQGLSEADIAKGLGMTTTQLRAQKSIERAAQKQADISQAQRLKDNGWSNTAIAERMGKNESSVRALLAPGEADKADVLQNTAKMLREEVAEKGLVDVGVGVELNPRVGVSREKMNTAIAILREEGYGLHYVKIPQLGTGEFTTMKVLAKPGVTYSEVFKDRANIKQIGAHTEDGGRTYDRIQPPLSIDSKRVGVRYAEDGGADADGVIYVRPGVDDVSLGGSSYAQVRIAVDGSHYLKGMALYKDDLPDGVDLVFNTNKSNSGNKLDAMKGMQKDKDGNIDQQNPFGASISRQLTKDVGDGKKQVTSVMNIVNEEGTWDTWSKSLSSQMLSKQAPSLAKQQLDLVRKTKKQELEEIMALTNPAVRKRLLQSYADDADAAAVHLKAAALPRQSTHVILPINTLNDKEVYAPNFRNGEKVVLVRYPHGGIFEIPELTVNNNHPQAKKALGNAKDAIGINSKVAERLSGADFDGDTVLVIPNNRRQVKTAPALEGLKGFDPKAAYPPYDGMKTMGGGTWDAKTGKEVFPPGKSSSGRTKGIQMGDVSNLITDMTIRGATQDELARAVRHSMVVIDAEKHRLNYKQSAIDNGIRQLKKKYQSKGTGDDAALGASTLISRAGAPIDVLDRKPRSAANGGAIDPKTGKKMYEYTGEKYVNRDGKTVVKSSKSKQLAETDDAHTLSSGTVVEKIYGDHSNELKALANRARKEMVNTKPNPYSPSAKKAYSSEVDSLNSKLRVALRNAPLERQAQVVANATLSAKRQANPDMEKDELKKLKSLALTDARLRVGAKKTRVDITDREWAAIQAGAISNSKLEQILANSDLDLVKKLATPKDAVLMTNVKTDRAKAMLNAGYTQAEVADALGVSLTTLKTAVGGEG